MINANYSLKKFKAIIGLPAESLERIMGKINGGL